VTDAPESPGPGPSSGIAGWPEADPVAGCPKVDPKALGPSLVSLINLKYDDEIVLFEDTKIRKLVQGWR
jgi:hypothetical protein